MNSPDRGESQQNRKEQQGQQGQQDQSQGNSGQQGQKESGGLLRDVDQSDRRAGMGRQD